MLVHAEDRGLRSGNTISVCSFTLLVPASAHGFHRAADPEGRGTDETEAMIEMAVPGLKKRADSRSMVESAIMNPSPQSRTR